MSIAQVLRDRTEGEEMLYLPTRDVPAPAPEPHLYDRLTEALTGLPWQTQLAIVTAVTVLVVGLVAVLGRGVAGLIRRISGAHQKEGLKSVEESHDQRIKRVRSLSERMTHTVGAYGSVISLTNTLLVLSPILTTWVKWLAYGGLALFAELLMISMVTRAWTNALERGRLGRDGAALWGIAGALAAIIWVEQPDPTLRVFIVVPLGVAFAYWKSLQGVAAATRKRLGSPEGAAEDFSQVTATVNPFKAAWQRLIAILGLLEGKGFTVADWARRRRVVGLARLVYLKEMAREAEKKATEGQKAVGQKIHFYSRRRDSAQLNTIVVERMAMIATRYADAKTLIAEVRPTVAMLLQATDSLTGDALDSLKMWEEQAAVAGTGTGTGTGTAPSGTPAGTDSGTRGGTPSGTRGTGAAGQSPVPPAGTSTAKRAVLAAGTAAPITAKTPMTVGEVATVRSSWTKEQRDELRDSAVARQRATEAGKAALAATGNAGLGMRAYFLVMEASGHAPTGVDMRRDVTDQEDTSGQGRKLLNQWKDDLAADSDDTKIAASEADRGR